MIAVIPLPRVKHSKGTPMIVRPKIKVIIPPTSKAPAIDVVVIAIILCFFCRS